MSLPEGVSVILAPNPSPMTLQGTNTYIVAGSEGCVVIDPGPEIESHLAAVAAAAREHGGARALLVTHGHPDHVAGAARLRALTGAPVWAYSREGTPVADATLADNALVHLGDRQLRALFTPGHRYDHLCFLLEGAGTIFAGDLVAGAGTVVIAPPEGDLNDYLASLRRLLTLDPHDTRLLAPGHGPAREDTRALLEGYIAHREQRERQLLTALNDGDSPQGQRVSDLVARIYTDVAPEMWPVAAYSTLAGLLKLEREGRAERVAESAADAVAPERSPLALEGVVGRPPGIDARWRLLGG
ncbi:MAG TPA: MBL fold metallo-hydrolase [Ktedonobacterales bacterium]|jgi:glyoxylase-like metal-dependent hydrolase (beta-lactamase superfamily II)|nr:MBL fold metallo-hydrolase [Ktedonobacterales bacterium]